MTPTKSPAKTFALIGCLTLFAAAVQAQGVQSTTKAGAASDADWPFLTWQTSSSTGGGTTTGTTGGSGGVISGVTPRPITTVVVTNPSLFTGTRP